MIWLLLVLLVALVAVAVFPFWRESRRLPMDTEARRAAPGKFVELSGGMAHYRWTGAARGPVAVCVHGLTTPSFVWGGVEQGLGEMGFRVLVYDLYGRGYSDRPAGRQDHEFFVRQLEELLESQAVREDITLLGYSMGGAVGTAFAAKHPEMMRRLVLLAPAGMGHQLGSLAAIAARLPILGDWLMLALFPRSHRRYVEAERGMDSYVEGIVDLQLEELEYRGFVPSVLASMRGMLGQPLEREHREISRADIPVVAIWGSDDTVIPIACMGRLTQWNRAVRQEVIDGAGHGLTYTHSQRVIDVIDEMTRD